MDAPVILDGDEIAPTNLHPDVRLARVCEEQARADGRFLGFLRRAALQIR